uniref:Uncharacterized protein n=1 Tax=Oryza meridionalis TaxID=40149 RepID=A0A0E0F1S2_9ORYZ
MAGLPEHGDCRVRYLADDDESYPSIASSKVFFPINGIVLRLLALYGRCRCRRPSPSPVSRVFPNPSSHAWRRPPFSPVVVRRPPPPTTTLASGPVPRRAVPRRRQPLPHPQHRRDAAHRQPRRRAAAASGQTGSWPSPGSPFASSRAPAAAALPLSLVSAAAAPPLLPRPAGLLPTYRCPCPNEMKRERGGEKTLEREVMAWIF